MSEKLAQLEKKGGNLTETVLWSNSSPSSSFIGQTVTLSDDLLSYDYVKVKFRKIKSESDEKSVMMSVTEYLSMSNAANSFCGMGLCIYISNTYYTRRTLSPDSTHVLFNNANRIDASGTIHDYLIPTAIIGMK